MKSLKAWLERRIAAIFGNTPIPGVSAPKLSPFHPLILLIEVTAVTLILSGTIGTFILSGWWKLFGTCAILIGGSIFSFGEISHSPSKPRQAGLITLLDNPICLFGKPVVVGGKVFVLPLIMNSIKINMDNYDHPVDVTVISGGTNPIPIKGKIIVTWRPDESDLIDYNQAGNDMKQIAEQIIGPVIAETKDIAKKLTPLQISQSGSLISAALERKINDELFQRKKFGLQLILVRADFPLPKTIEESMEKVMAEDYEREAEKKDSQTITDIARDMQREDAIQFIPRFNGQQLKDIRDPNDLKIIDDEICKHGGLLDQKKVSHFNEYRKAAERRRLIRDQKVSEINVTGVQGSFYMAGTESQKK